MKLTSLTVALAISLSFSALAADKTGEKSKDAKPTKVQKAKKAGKSVKRPEQVALTGSYIKKDIRQSGVVTDGPEPVFVLDDKAIRNSGAADLRELLVFRGLNR